MAGELRSWRFQHLDQLDPRAKVAGAVILALLLTGIAVVIAWIWVRDDASPFLEEGIAGSEELRTVYEEYLVERTVLVAEAGLVDGQQSVLLELTDPELIESQERLADIKARIREEGSPVYVDICVEWNFLLTMQTIELAAFIRPGKAYSAPSEEDVQNSLINAFQASLDGVEDGAELSNRCTENSNAYLELLDVDRVAEGLPTLLRDDG